MVVSIKVSLNTFVQVFFFFTLVTGPRWSLRLKLSDARVYQPQLRARLGTTVQVFGVKPPARVTGVQTVGGSGALRVLPPKP